MRSLLVLIGLSLALTTAPTLAFGLRLEPTKFAVGRDSVAAEIGRFSVPENRAQPGGKTLELAFVRFKSTAAKPGPPIVYLAGGPGGSATGAARGLRFPLFQAMRAYGDVIAFDQRGTGISGPNLTCPEAGPMPLDRALSRADRAPFLVAATSACGESLRARGHDLSAFNTNESADDLEDLRKELGAETLTLWGISYGTHLALATIKRHPDSIDRVILAGIEGLDRTFKLPADQERLLKAISDLAAAAPETRTATPNLHQSIRKLLTQLETTPRKVDITDPVSGTKGTIVLAPFDLQLVLASMLTGPSSFAPLPALIADLERGKWDNLALEAADNRIRLPLYGMSLAMDCGSGQSEAWKARIAEEAKGTLLGDAINWPFPEVCTGLGVPDLGDAFRAPASSSIPALLISGTLDGRTPPTNAEAILPGFPNAQHLVIEGAGHSDPLFLSSPTILECMQAFMRNEPLPTKRVVLPPVRFRAPSSN